MGIADIASSPEAQAFAGSLASTYGISPQAAQGAVAGLLPALVKGVEANTLSRGGIADLMQALSTGHHQNVIDTPGAVGQPETVADGNAIIGHLLGSSGLPQSALQAAAGQSGLSASMLGKLAPMIAVFLLGYVFKHAGGMLGNIVGSAMGAGGGSGGGGGFALPGGMGLPSGMGLPQMGGVRTGGGGLMPGLPDLTRLGPNNNPYGNIANSIRNGGSLGGATAGGVRDILGSVLGFGSSRGIMGWIIRALVLRFGMSILRAVLRNFIR